MQPLEKSCWQLYNHWGRITLRTSSSFLRRTFSPTLGFQRYLLVMVGHISVMHSCRRCWGHYNVKHKVISPYHPQINGQAELSNRELKKILENTIASSRKDWAMKLDNALWAYKTAFKIPIGISRFHMVYGKTCHLPIHMEQRAYWALKFLNFDASLSREKQKLHLLELEEMKLNAYESSKIYMQKMKAYHDWKLVKRNFQPRQQVLLLKSRIQLFPRKLKSKWFGPFIIKDVKPCGAIELMDPSSTDPEHSWIVNGQRLKVYNGGNIERLTTIIHLNDP